MSRRIWFLLLVFFWGVFLAACSAAAPEDEAETIIIEKEGEIIIVTDEVGVDAEEPAVEAPAEEAAQPMPSATLAPQGTAAPTQAAPTPPLTSATPLVEARLVEVEWPERLQLGDSDVVRMALIPSEKGYTLTTEFPDHSTITQDVPVVRPEGYDLSAVGRLDGVGFTISPSKDQVSSLPIDQPVIWHWSLTAGATRAAASDSQSTPALGATARHKRHPAGGCGLLQRVGYACALILWTDPWTNPDNRAGRSGPGSQLDSDRRSLRVSLWGTE